MPGAHGDILGAELGQLYHAGQHDIPKVSGDYETAWTNIPYAVSASCGRGGGLGVNPGANLDAMCDKVNAMLTGTKSSLDAIGTALVWLANTYAETDGTCAKAFNAKKRSLEAQDGA